MRPSLRWRGQPRGVTMVLQRARGVCGGARAHAQACAKVGVCFARRGGGSAQPACGSFDVACARGWLGWDIARLCGRVCGGGGCAVAARWCCSGRAGFAVA